MENKETGEICGNVVRIKSTGNINVETGETEYATSVNKPCFKIPNAMKKEEKKFRRPKPHRKLCCSKSPQKYFLLLAYITLSVILPSVACTLWLFAETIHHVYLHRIKASGHPLHNLLVSEFCAICQSERSMTLIGKLQDERTNKMRQYVKNLSIGT